MSIEYTAYLGPYVEYTVATKKVVFSHCPHPSSCPNPSEGYCQKCGKHTSQISYTSFQDVPEFDLIEVFGETLWSPLSPEEVNGRRKYVAIPNEIREGMPKRKDHWDTRRDEVKFNVHPEQIAFETDAFKQAFALEIEELKARCGSENVQVCWGLLLYAW